MAYFFQKPKIQKPTLDWEKVYSSFSSFSDFSGYTYLSKESISIDLPVYNEDTSYIVYVAECNILDEHFCFVITKRHNRWTNETFYSVVQYSYKSAFLTVDKK